MRIRLATADDIPALVSIERHAVTAAHWTDADYRAIFEQSTPRRIAMLIEFAGDVVPPEFPWQEEPQLLRGIQGFIVTRYFDGEWEIENIAVEPTARRRGLASRLLESFVEFASGDGGREVLLEVRESNIAARKLYERHGFSESGRRKSYYTNPLEDAVLLRRALGRSTYESS